MTMKPNCHFPHRGMLQDCIVLSLPLLCLSRLCLLLLVFIRRDQARPLPTLGVLYLHGLYPLELLELLGGHQSILRHHQDQLLLAVITDVLVDWDFDASKEGLVVAGWGLSHLLSSLILLDQTGGLPIHSDRSYL